MATRLDFVVDDVRAYAEEALDQLDAPGVVKILVMSALDELIHKLSSEDPQDAVETLQQLWLLTALHDIGDSFKAARKAAKKAERKAAKEARRAAKRA